MKEKNLIIISLFVLFLLGTITNDGMGLETELKIINGTSYQISRTWPILSLLYPDEYHTPETLTEELIELNNSVSELIDLFVIGKSIENRDIYCIKVSNEQNILPKAGVLFLAHHHAREQITIEITLRFLSQLVNNYGTDTEITDYIDNQDIYIIPSLNPDSLPHVLGNSTLEPNPWLRKNLRKFDDDNDGKFDEDPIDDENGDGIISGYDVYLNQSGSYIYQYSYYEGIDNDGDGFKNEDIIGGVDLNRNYAYRWNDSSCTTGATGDTTDDTYPGTAAFSEPETQAFRDFMEDKSFAMAMSLHSGTNATYFPWASQEASWSVPTLYNEIYYDLKDILPYRFFGDGYLSSRISANTQGLAYTSAGDWGDWMYAEKNCLVPLTFEIYHNGSSQEMIFTEVANKTYYIERWDCIYEYFAPVESEEYFDSLWEDIQPAFNYWLDNTPRLEMKIRSITGGKNQGDSLTVTLNLKNLSPRISTIQSLEILKEDYQPVMKDNSPLQISGVEGDDTESRSFTFTLEETLDSGDNLSLLIGNDYIGYKKIIIEEKEIGKSIPFDFFASLLAIPVIVSLKLIRNRKTKPTNHE